MKPFRDYDLSVVIANQLSAARKKIDTMSNEEIMANNLEVLAENIFQQYFIEPITIFEEDFSKRNIKQAKIQQYVNPIFRTYPQPFPFGNQKVVSKSVNLFLSSK